VKDVLHEIDKLAAFGNAIRHLAGARCGPNVLGLSAADVERMAEDYAKEIGIEICRICGAARDAVGGTFCSAPHAVSYPDYVKGRAEFAIEQLGSLLAVVDSYRPSQIKDLLNERIEAIRSRTEETLGPGATS
jgi:hypothetical protein